MRRETAHKEVAVAKEHQVEHCPRGGGRRKGRREGRREEKEEEEQDLEIGGGQ